MARFHRNAPGKFKLDLWTPVVPTETQHLNFRRVLLGDPSDRAVLDGWAEGFPDRDGKFVVEFQSTFNSSFWELYLHACFREVGATMSYPASPDFALCWRGREMVAEATTAQQPDGFLSEAEGKYTDPSAVDVEELLNLATVRIANAISAKVQKYRCSYSKLKHVAERPFVLCVAPFEQPHFWMQGDRAVRRVLYRYDAPVSIVDHEDGGRVILGHEWRDIAGKHTGASVPLGLFADDGMHEVSAIIFSSCATWGKVRALSCGGAPGHFVASRYNDAGVAPNIIRETKDVYRETLLDGLHIFFNPYASNPLPREMFEGREVALHFFDPVAQQYWPNVPDGFLYQRFVVSFVNRATQPELAALGRSPYQQHHRHWAERELISVGSQMGPFVDTHIAHYQGWTVLVSRCSVDGDWCAQAIPRICRSVAAFVLANNDESVPTPLFSEWVGTKEEAAGQAFIAIDRAIQVP